MSGSGLASVGQILREAREAQGITLDNAAMRLRLMHRQVEAMERDDFESLGQPVFARGFVRNYARLLGLVPESLLARMDGGPTEPAAFVPTEPALPRSWLTSPWLILSLLGLLLVVAVPVALYAWLNSDGGERPDAPTPAVMQPRPAAAVATAPVAAPADVVAPAPAPASPVIPATTDGTPPEAPASGAVESAAEGSVLHLDFGDESWTEIKDASGRMLMRQLNPAGSSADVHGQPPFDVVIGNATQVQMTYNGRPIDLKPFIDVTVARFTLEE
ncbi:MAG: helix-turn-helix domain-containing protein [Thiobacillus sp.]|uniref:helix-turn-helix domain-containing protein n=1 Tax=Thiobacillus sp. TaxID=924 RepID=UPI001AD2F854|nr:helix-turn-helix domain-containing protein [Thiobacillus sp.]MBN8771069.1 helix-turn-helix domain-containing protein [Thiobacillus sp.]MBN8780064.1 helix-turn-helix domain-containing protein [Thiobacillus sp.]